MSFFQMHPILLNLAATWTGNRPLRWTDVITAAYYCRIYILFLACECCYANGMCALWTAGFRWLISATHLQSAFVWGPTAWWQRCFFQICSNWSKNNAPGMLFGNVHILGMSSIFLFFFAVFYFHFSVFFHQIVSAFHYIWLSGDWSGF